MRSVLNSGLSESETAVAERRAKKALEAFGKALNKVAENEDPTRREKLRTRVTRAKLERKEATQLAELIPQRARELEQGSVLDLGLPKKEST